MFFKTLMTTPKTPKRACPKSPLPFVMLALITVAFSLLSAQAYAATVTTDRNDYLPGDTVFITGSGWDSGETVALEIVENPLIHPAETLIVTADDMGDISAEYAIQEHDLGQAFKLTATGQTSGLTAQTTFTDGKPTRIQTSSMSPSSGACGTTITVHATLEAKETNTDPFTPLAAKTVTFTLGSSTGMGVTDPNGIATAMLTVSTGATSLVASFAADAIYNAISQSIPFTVTGSCCGNGITESPEQCDGGSCCTSSCTLKASTDDCRASAGGCDVAEFCTGSSGTCPADEFQSNTTTCRPAAGACDVAEICSGSSATCPADGFQSSATVCRASAGACDVAEICSGSSAACPTNRFQPSATVCRASAGACDLSETCDGSSDDCPSDAKSTAVCRASAGACDIAETCDGSSNDCPSDAKSTAVCRGSAGACDLSETCDGSSNDCPSDAKSTAVCRGSAGACDLSETCDGSSDYCPGDIVVASGTACRESAGACDLAETCDGSSNACPSDAKSTAVCRAAVGQCDIAENCNGVSNNCPADGFQPSTTSCSDANACTQTDACSGTSDTCVGTKYSWSGVLQPINSDCGSVFKLGSTIPVKFRLTGACDGNPNVVAKIYLAKITNSIIGSDVEASSTSAADSGNTFRYDPANGQYIFNLATKPLSAGTWQIRVDLGDGWLGGALICSDAASSMDTRKIDISLKK